MNIALVILHADASRGGAEGYTVNLARALIERGHNVSLLASAFGQNLPPAQQVHLRPRGLTRLAQYENFLDDVDEHLNRDHYDVVHAMLPVRRCDVYHPHAGLAFQGVELGHLRHNRPLLRAASQFSNRFNRKRRRFAAVEHRMMHSGQPPFVLCLTDAMRADAVARFGAQEAHIRKLFYGIDLARFDPAARPDAGTEIRQRFGISPQQIVALIVAQDFERKGVPEAIDTVARANDPRLTLLVVGRENPQPMQRLAKNLSVSDRVIFAGATTDVYAFFKAADFLLFPARVDPCPLVVLESICMGVPVIVTRQAGSSEAVTNAREGFVIDQPTNVPAMADAARQLLEPSLRQQMSAACMQRRAGLAYEHHLDALLGIYGEVVRSREPGARSQ